MLGAIIGDIAGSTYETKEIEKRNKNSKVSYEERIMVLDRNSKTIEDKIFKNIIEYLGSDKVVVKLHPRTRVNRFKDFNVQIMESKGIPWEALAIACNFNNIKMLTLASGSVINSRLMLGDSSKALMLYKCVDSTIPSIGKNFDMFMNSFLKNHSNELIIPNSINELRCQIDKIRENELG